MTTRASSGGVKKSAVFTCVTPESRLRHTTAVVARLDSAVTEQAVRAMVCLGSDTGRHFQTASGQQADDVGSIHRALSGRHGPDDDPSCTLAHARARAVPLAA